MEVDKSEDYLVSGLYIDEGLEEHQTKIWVKIDSVRPDEVKKKNGEGQCTICRIYKYNLFFSTNEWTCLFQLK